MEWPFQDALATVTFQEVYNANLPGSRSSLKFFRKLPLTTLSVSFQYRNVIFEYNQDVHKIRWRSSISVLEFCLLFLWGYSAFTKVRGTGQLKVQQLSCIQYDWISVYQIYQSNITYKIYHILWIVSVEKRVWLFQL